MSKLLAIEAHPFHGFMIVTPGLFIAAKPMLGRVRHSHDGARRQVAATFSLVVGCPPISPKRFSNTSTRKDLIAEGMPRFRDLKWTIVRSRSSCLA
jgi:hypothetical protein